MTIFLLIVIVLLLAGICKDITSISVDTKEAAEKIKGAVYDVAIKCDDAFEELDNYITDLNKFNIELKDTINKLDETLCQYNKIIKEVEQDGTKH